MKILPEMALTYDDVLLVPQYSNVDSRRLLSTKSCLTKKIALQMPIVSANMDVVTESEMAITMAREGGIGMIHRFMTIAEQARQIGRVKKAESFIVDRPITMTESGVTPRLLWMRFSPAGNRHALCRRARSRRKRRAESRAEWPPRGRSIARRRSALR